MARNDSEYGSDPKHHKTLLKHGFIHAGIETDGLQEYYHKKLPYSAFHHRGSTTILHNTDESVHKTYSSLSGLNTYLTKLETQDD